MPVSCHSKIMVGIFVIIAKKCLHYYFWLSCVNISYALPPKLQVCGKEFFLRKSQLLLTVQKLSILAKMRMNWKVVSWFQGAPISPGAPGKRSGGTRRVGSFCYFTGMTQLCQFYKSFFIQFYLFSNTWAIFFKKDMPATSLLPSSSRIIKILEVLIF